MSVLQGSSESMCVKPALKAVVGVMPRSLERAWLALKRGRCAKTAAGRALVDTLLYPADVYRVVSRYRRTFGRLPNLYQPKSFSEWLQQSKLMRRKALHTQLADKLAVREYVQSKVGNEVLPHMIWSGNELISAKSVDLPSKFVIKCNHGSGLNIVVTDASSFDWTWATEITRELLARDYSIPSAEWQYRWIPPKLLIEEFLEGADGKVPLDYKFFCFHGRVRLIQVDFDRFTRHTRAFLDPKFELLPVGLLYPRADRPPPKPACFDRMIELAEILAEGEPFLRVDLYDMGRPIFGELTFHPESGLGKFTPSDWDERVFRYLERVA